MIKKAVYLARVEGVHNTTIKAHQREPGGIYPGDQLDYSLLCLRNNSDKEQRGPWLCDLTWPYKESVQIDGSGVDEGVAQLLTGLVAALRPRVVLETGTHKGRSTQAIAMALDCNEQGHMWTVDMDNYGTLDAALSPDERRRVTQIVGRSPQCFDQEPLKDLVGIDFAFIDGDHTKEGVLNELAFVDAHRASTCWVALDNTRDAGWVGVREALDEYTDYPKITLNTMCGMDIIQMSDTVRNRTPKAV